MSPHAISSSVLSPVPGWQEVHGSPVLMSVIALAALGTTVVFVISLVAYHRRRETAYLLISLAVGALVLRSVVGFGTVMGRVPMGYHHLVEHTLDFAIAVLVLTAVYLGGATPTETD